MRLFYTTDLHGSEVCWRKFLSAATFYKADVLICGGDMTGKAMIPLVDEGDHYEFALSGQHQRVAREEIADVESQIQRKGYYPVRMSSARVAELEADPNKVQSLFTEEMCKTVARWMDMAEDKLGKCIDLGGFEMISSGWANPTPWHTYREAPEEDLARMMEPMLGQIKEMSRAIFNFHPPPYGTSLDEAPALDENLKVMHGGKALRHVGSTAVRAAIDKYQPMLSLHGHIHEGKGITRLGKTLSINTGSAYEEGILMSAILELDQKKGIKSYQLISG